MNNEQILKLYMIRDQQAIAETNDKYRNYLYHIAYGILKSHEDTEECINDTYTKLWDSIPPKKPLSLSAYAAKITKNLAINKKKYNMAEKRSDTNTVIFDELESVLLTGENADDRLIDEMALSDALNHFLAGITPKNRVIFIRRYWQCESIKEISEYLGCSEGSVRVSLKRTRDKLKKYLKTCGLSF